MNGARSVLVVDDEASLRLLARLNLEAHGFRVREAASGEEAIEILESYEPDVLLLDIRMPGVDGWAVLEWLESNQRLPASRIIVLSAHATGHALDRARRKGLRYIKKPFRINELVDAVTKAAA
ncbi:MAG: response regulator [Thermoleophilia bacterium]|nr:response regulator [Thermoleophilia bacterium]